MNLSLRLVTIAVLLAFPSTAGAYNNLNDRSFGDTPWTSASIFTATTDVFNNSSFTIESGEASSPPRFLGCGSWGSKTAWVRFHAGVAGNARVTIDSSIPGPGGHDVFYNVYTADGVIPAGDVAYNDLTEVDCINSNTGPDETYSFGYAIPGNRWIYIQALSVCRSGPALPYCSAQEQADAPGGPMTINLRFTPDDTETPTGDGVPDTLDNCPSVSNSGQEDQDSDGTGDVCDSDLDGDGSANDADNCPAVPNGGQANLDDDDLGDDCDPDRDGDGDPDETDCGPTEKDVHRGARDIRGNRIDENCDGEPTPYRFVKNGVSPAWVGLHGDVRSWAYFTIENARKGMRIRIECKGPGCRRSAKEYRVKRGGDFRVGMEFPKESIEREDTVGTKVKVKIMRRKFVGRLVKYTIDGKGLPKRGRGCLPVPFKPEPERRDCTGIGGR